MKKVFLLLALVSLVSGSLFSQAITARGIGGLSFPQGDVFKDSLGVKQASFGFGYDLDIIYYHGFLDDKLGLGLMYSGNVIFGKSDNSALSIGVYGLSMYGVKGVYRLFPVYDDFSIYGGLGLGVSTLVTPQFTMGETVIIPSSKSSSIGIRPEIGLEYLRFVMSVAYMVPMKYDVASSLGSFKGSAGLFTISVGYRFQYDF